MPHVYSLSEPTIIHTAPQNQVVRANTNIVFECEATTDPLEAAHLIITWRRNGEEINFDNEPRFRLNANDNTLTIMASEIDDSGVYTCVAENGVDSDEATAVLTVEGMEVHPKSWFCLTFYPLWI